VLYLQSHFSLEPPYGFTEDSNPKPPMNAPIALAPLDPRLIQGGHTFTGGGKR